MMPEKFSIAAISEHTGLAKEVLRKWESRYGFPMPQRDGSGKRSYLPEHVERLILIKRLIDSGMRPAQIVPLNLSELSTLAAVPARPVDATTDAIATLLAVLQTHDHALLLNLLNAQLQQHGLHDFVIDLMPAMNYAVGEAWATGSIGVRGEHLYTEMLQGLLRSALTGIHQATGWPRVLLTTAPDEAHGLGLLMMETLLSLQGACCISLGTRLPLDEIVLAVRDYRIDVLGLSFSIGFPIRKITPLLTQLRAQLAPSSVIWAGGAGVARLNKTPRGTTLLPSLAAGLAALQTYRAHHTNT